MGELRHSSTGYLETLTKSSGTKFPAILIALSAIAWLMACASTTTEPVAKSSLPATATATAIATVAPTSTPLAPTPTPAPTVSPTPEATATPQSALFEYSRAVILLEVQEFDRSIAAFGLVIRKLPDFARAYQGRGLAFFGDERYELAMEDFDTAIDLAPKFPGTYVDRARLSIRLENIDEAVRDLEQAILLYDPVRHGESLDAANKLLDSIRP